jgi:hypothetical protein
MVFKSADDGKTSRREGKGREGRDVDGNAQKKETLSNVLFWFEIFLK